MSKTFNLEEYDTIVINDLSLNGSFLTNFQVGVPIGTILPWQDINTIPDGWKLCDGNGTYTDISGITRQIPDLRSKFIIGHDARDTSFNIDTSGSSFIHEDTDLNTNNPRSQMVLNDTNKHPTDNTPFRRIFYSLAYIIRVSNPNISTDTAGDKVINGDLTATGKLIANGDLSANGNLFANGDLTATGKLIANGDLSANGNLYVSNNVGIGIDNPQHNLTIYNTTPSIQLINTSSGSTGNDGMVLEQYGLNTYFKNNENGNIFFRTQNNNTRMMIQENGYIGIGTTSPSSTLDVNGSIRGGYNSDTPSYFGRVAIGHATNTSDFASFSHIDHSSDNSYAVGQTSSGGTIINSKSGAQGIRFKINNVEKMQLTDDGWVGIGTASPSAKLDVNGSIYGGFIYASGFLQCNGEIFYLGKSDRNVIKYKSQYLKWEAYDNQALTHFWRMSEYTGSTSQIYFHNSVGANNCYVRALSVASTSDDRLKTNETLLTNATETLMKLKPQLYDHYTNESLKTEPIKSVGLIAQEIYYAAPELRDYVVHLPADGSGNMCSPTEADLSNQDPANDPDYDALGWTKDEYASVDYTKLIPYLIKSNQEQQEEINTLKSRLSALENN